MHVNPTSPPLEGESNNFQVIIVGAGPSGLVLALLLARCTPPIQVSLLDHASTVDNRPRAAHYAPSAIRVLSAAGVLPDVRRDGLIPKNMTWRKLDGSVITFIPDVAQPWSPDALTVLPLNMLGKVLLEHCNKNEHVNVKWNQKVVDVQQDSDAAWAVLDNGEKISGDYLVGCDGANSIVRRSLFGNKFEGKTWDAQIVATNVRTSITWLHVRYASKVKLFTNNKTKVYYPFENFGYDDINFIIHPEHYYMAAKITTDGLWRVSYGEDTKLTQEEVVANQPKKYEMMLPGNPKPGDYKLLNVGPYRIHQRCAERFRVGRVLLAADAAHLVNPFGGLGLTGGLVDVGGLAECFEGLVAGLTSESILDKYDEVRRERWENVINPISSDNFLRVSATDASKALDEIGGDEFLKMVEVARKDGLGSQSRKDLDEGVYAVCADFKQYFDKRDTKAEANGKPEAKL